MLVVIQILYEIKQEIFHIQFNTSTQTPILWPEP